MTSPDQTVNQVDYIQTLEDDLARETRARRLLTTMVAQKDRVIQAYYERYGDITAPEQPAPTPAPEPAPEAPVG